MNQIPGKKKVIKAIGALGNRVTVADVVAQTGLPLSDASQLLNQIAAESLGTLEVTSTGDVFYVFSKHFAYGYLTQGLRKAVNQIWAKVWPVLFLLYRVSFGLMLLFSVCTILCFILIFQSIMSGLLGSTQSVGPMWMNFFGLIGRIAIRDLLAWDQTIKDSAGTEIERVDKQNFLLGCYHFLFGEGDPNKNIDEDAWTLIAQAIRLNEGVVLAEHLSPYTGTEPGNESMIFAVLAKFNGYPVVSDTGNLIYVFPTMRARSQVSSYAFMPPYLEHKHWRFTNMSKAAMRPVLGLAWFNFIGSMWFWFLCLPHVAGQTFRLNMWFFLAVYGTLFMVVPALRFCWVKLINKNIDQENIQAKNYESVLGAPSPELVKRLEEAEQLRQSDRWQGYGEVVYRTNKDYLEQISDRDFLAGNS